MWFEYMRYIIAAVKILDRQSEKLLPTLFIYCLSLSYPLYRYFHVLMDYTSMSWA